MKRIFKLTALTLSLCCLALLFTACTEVRGEKYYNSDLYAPSSSFSYGNEIANIYIEWEIGNVHIISCEKDTFEVNESYSGVEQAKQMHYYKNGDTLYVQFWESGHRGEIAEKSKNLVIEVPKTLSILDVETEEAQIYSGELICTNVNLSSEKGEITIDKLSCSTAELENDRADIVVGITGASFVDIDNDLGDVTISLFDKGASVYFETDRGKINSSLSFIKNGLTYKFGDGALNVNVETDRGNLKVK